MSWKFEAIGSPKRIAEALASHGSSMPGPSRAHFDSVKSHLIALVGQNFANEQSGVPQPMIRFSAAGGGLASGGGMAFGNCSVSLETVTAKLMI